MLTPFFLINYVGTAEIGFLTTQRFNQIDCSNKKESQTSVVCDWEVG